MSLWSALPTPVRRLTFAALNLGLLLCLYASLAQPWIASRSSKADSIENLRLSIGRLKSVVDKEGSVQSLIAEAKASQTSSEVWRGATEAAISAAVQARLREMADVTGVRLRSLRGLPAAEMLGAKGVTVRVEANGDLASLQAFLTAIETETPYLFVSALVLVHGMNAGPSGPGAEPILDIQIDVGGVIRAGGA